MKKQRYSEKNPKNPGRNANAAKLCLLNTRDIKKLRECILEQWGADLGAGCDDISFSEYALLKNQEDKIFLATRDIEKVDFSKLRVNSIGIYFGKIDAGQLRLSIEGSQVIGRLAKRNVVEIDSKQAAEWMAGEQLIIDTKFIKQTNVDRTETGVHGFVGVKGFVIIKYKNDFLGTGKVSTADGKLRILNYVPKGRRICLHE